jgi:tRNA A37 threonylcarbamoyladenosine synthetase subunit TsaC/SUA5/YrdC
MGEDLTRGLPADLVSALRDQSIVVPQDAAVFELVAAWAKAPSATASAEISAEPDLTLVEALYRQTNAAHATTGVGC